MEKKIEDYLHFYLGCDVITTSRIEYWHDDEGQYVEKIPKDSIITGNDTRFLFETGYKFKLLLRPLSDMTEEEEDYINDEFSFGHALSNLGKSLKEGNLYQMRVTETFEITRYLLSKSFDLFGLIESGLALDKTKQITYGNSKDKN